MVKTITNSKRYRNAIWSSTHGVKRLKNKERTSGHKKYAPTQVEVKIMTQVIEYIHNYIPWLKRREPLEIIELVI
jgi:hypothetical protein